MKKLFYILIASLVAVCCVACSSDDDPVVIEGGIAGEWKLMEWEGYEELPFHVYLALNRDGSFELYQKIETLTYEKLTGHYAVDKTLFTGKYSDGQPLAAEYDYTLSDTKNTMVMVSRGEKPETMVYVRIFIPEEVKQSAEMTRSEVSAEGIL